MSKKEQEVKTNAVRALNKAKIPFELLHYPSDKALSAVEVAPIIGVPTDNIYKTLVTVGKSGEHYVFIVPGAKELDLKLAGKVSNEKSIEMIKSKDLLPLTGYIHGGCSPLGMKKHFKTFIDESVLGLDYVVVSGGKIGVQIKIAPHTLIKVADIMPPCPIAK